MERTPSPEVTAKPGTGLPADPAAPSPRRVERREWAWLAAASVVVLAAASLPWLWAALRTPASLHWSGFIWYPPDDSLLLSALWEGVRGHWLHRPPYALADGPGALFYPEYLLLGHVSAWTRLDPVTVLHLARLACGALLLVSLYSFVARFHANLPHRRFAFLLAATGAGLGWVVLLFTGVRSTEMSMPETFPFFAMLASLHLTLALAALLWVLDALVPEGGGPPRGRRGRLVAGALVLAIVQPFGTVIAGAVGGAWAAARWVRERRPPRGALLRLLVLAAASLPFILHEIATIALNPAYAGWREQVRTPAPPAWQLVLAAGLLLPFALAGAVKAARRRSANDLLLLAWLAATAVLVALPWYQSRRFDFAAYVPVALLAAIALERARGPDTGLERGLFVTFNALGSALVLGASLMLMVHHDRTVFMSRDEWDAVRFLRAHARECEVVLAPPATSMFVMASAPLRVVHGHPAETPRAAATRASVEDFYRGAAPLPDTLLARVDWIVAGARGPTIPAGFERAFAAGDVEVYGRQR